MFWKTVLWIVIAVHSMKRELPKSSTLYMYMKDKLKKRNRKSGQMFLTSIWWLKKNHFWVFSCNLTLKWVCSDWPTADFPRELIATQRSPKHVAEIKCAVCFLSREKCKIVVCELVSETPLTPLKNDAIDHFPIAHNTLRLPPKFCITYCLKMLLGKCNTPRSI